MQSLTLRLAELYTAVFDRAPDAAGLAYWSAELASGTMNLEAIAANWMTSQPEALQRYPLTMSSNDFIEAIYANVLDRQPVAADYTYWGTQLNNGAVSRDAFIAAIINGAKANSSPQGQLDAALLANRATVGIAFAEQGLNDRALATHVLQPVDSSPTAARAITALISLAQDDSDGLVLGLQGLGLAWDTSALHDNIVTYLEHIAANVGHANRLPLFLSIGNTLIEAAGNPAQLAAPLSRANESLAQAAHDGIPPDTGANLTLTGTTGIADTFSFPADTHKVHIEGFEPDRDLLSLNAAAGVQVLYRGEAATYALLTEQFDGTPGQAAMVRESQELVIDVNGDNLISAADIVITLPGVWQLEEYNFI